jgi:hypothetical protein
VAERAATNLNSIEPPLDVAPRLTEILASPDIRAVIRDVYIFRVGGERSALERTGAAFRRYWIQVAPKDARAADKVFEILLEAADMVLNWAIHEGSLAAHDTRSAMHHQVILDHVRAVERKVDLLSGDTAVLGNYDAFEALLRSEIAARTGYITPPDFHRATRVPINQLYVPHSITEYDRTGRETHVDYRQWLSRVGRCVVLGDPGAGKSTLARKLCHDMATNYARDLMEGRLLTPWIVTLRDYSAAKEAYPQSFRQYLEVQAQSHYQLSPPENAVEYLLTVGRLLIVFDGLDELLDTRHRQGIRADIESFTRRYPSVPIIVTSRLVGYDQAPLDPRLFSQVRLAPFDGLRVEEYAKKWFAFDTELSPERQGTLASSFVEESAIANDLRSTPLLLALMCNLYRGHNYIPRNLPSIYESCARMLFEVWDKSRGIDPILPIAEHLRPTMDYLANWIFQGSTLRSGVTRAQLIEKSAEFLLRWRFDDPHVARHAASEFVDFCRGRAWVFSDMGSTEDGEELFSFTHKTFLEYFTAAHLVASHARNEDLVDELAPHIASEEWDVVAQLAFHIRSRALIGGADDLLAAILSRASESSVTLERRNFVSFAVRTLAYLVPTPVTVRTVISQALDWSLSQIAADNRNLGSATGGVTSIEPVVLPIMRVNEEVADVARAAVGDTLAADMLRNDERAAVAARMCCAIGARVTGEVDDKWRMALGELAATHEDRIHTLARREPALMMDLIDAGWLQLGDVLKTGDAYPAFVARRDALRDRVHPPSAYLAARVLTVAGVHTEEIAIDEAERCIRELAKGAKELVLPWITRDAAQLLQWLPWYSPRRQEARLEISRDHEVRFGLFVVAATIVDAARACNFDIGKKSWTGSVQTWVALLEIMFSRQTEHDATAEIRAYFRDPGAIEFVTRWLDGTVAFVRP